MGAEQRLAKAALLRRRRAERRRSEFLMLPCRAQEALLAIEEPFFDSV